MADLFYFFEPLESENLQYNDVKLYLYSFVIDPLPHLGLGQQEGYIQFEVSPCPLITDLNPPNLTLAHSVRGQLYGIKPNPNPSRARSGNIPDPKPCTFSSKPALWKHPLTPATFSLREPSFCFIFLQ